MSTASFWDNIAPRYAAKPISDMAAYEATLERTRSFLHANDHILEIGCGTGGTALHLSSSVAQVTATDISSKMLGIAEEKLRNGGQNNVRFLQVPAMKPMADAPFDAICGFSILHLLPDLPGTVAHLKTQVKPGGFVITKTTCVSEIPVFMRWIIKVMQLVGKAPDLTFFTADALDAAFTKAGFELIETGYFGNNHTARFVVARRP